jgi:hypothetical protein
MPAGTFGRRIIAGTDRHITIVELIDHHPNARASRIDTAILWIGMICGAGDLAGTASDTFVKIDFDFFDDSLF